MEQGTEVPLESTSLVRQVIHCSTIVFIYYCFSTVERDRTPQSE